MASDISFLLNAEKSIWMKNTQNTASAICITIIESIACPIVISYGQFLNVDDDFISADA